ncbi:MAG: hypothetical protein WBI82_16200 [Sphaerochaeta sp.]
MNELYVVIPTYWQCKTTRKPHPDDLVFDHPTFLDGDDTLSASLESLAGTDNPKDFRVLVLSSAVHPSLEEEVIDSVGRIIKKYATRLHIGHFHAKKLKVVQQRLVALGYSKDYPSKVLKPVCMALQAGTVMRGGETLVHDSFATMVHPGLFQMKQSYQNDVYRKM